MGLGKQGDGQRRQWGRARRTLSAAAVLAACLAAAPTAHAITAPQAVALLNQQRAANGIPGDLSEVGSMDSACQNQLAYGKAHDNALDPSIDSSQGLSGTTGGWLGVTNIQPWQWTASVDPWSWIPEEKWVMDPHTQLIGYADQAAPGGWVAGDVWACVATAQRAIPGPVRLFSYPGDGTAKVPTQATLWSATFGLPQGATVGPSIAYWLTGDQGAIDRSVAMSGPGGPVDLATTQGSGVALPRSALQPHSAYQVTVVWQLQAAGDQSLASSSGPQVTQHFTFTTGVAGDASVQSFAAATPARPAKRHRKARARPTKARHRTAARKGH